MSIGDTFAITGLEFGALFHSGVAVCKSPTRVNFLQVAFIPYLTAGDPDLETTATAAKMLESYGADIIELGIPYSDPLADGPVLQACRIYPMR